MKRRFLILTLGAAVAVAFGGCGNRENSESSAPAARVDASTAGSITGTVTLDGAPPVSKTIDMSASPACV
ncbi:MAG: hypothetical protein WB559_14600, partial [Candidatus Acidiferrales bacterium]